MYSRIAPLFWLKYGITCESLNILSEPCSFVVVAISCAAQRINSSAEEGIVISKSSVLTFGDILLNTCQKPRCFEDAWIYESVKCLAKTGVVGLLNRQQSPCQGKYILCEILLSEVNMKNESLILCMFLCLCMWYWYNLNNFMAPIS